MIKMFKKNKEEMLFLISIVIGCAIFDNIVIRIALLIWALFMFYIAWPSQLRRLLSKVI